MEAGARLPIRLRIRLLGGFEIWHGDRPVQGFESQKVRALAAYLLCHRGRAFSRDHLVGLLWPGRGADAARHALRQAVYNLRSVLPDGDGEPPILTRHADVQWNPALACWLDVEEFETAIDQGKAHAAVDPHRLAMAAQLYRGELLAGFLVRDCQLFEQWRTAEQERLRQSAVDVLRTLVDGYRRRGEHRFGIHYARQRVAIEPLAEEAHRDLMRLCALAGRRGQALAVYDRLAALLAAEREIEPEPEAETRQLRDEILAECEPAAAEPVEERGPIGPLIPLVGREEPLAALAESWRRTLAGSAQLTLVAGEAGAGKTRLVRSFLNSVTVQQQAVVLKGRCCEMAPRTPYGPFADVVGYALSEEGEAVEAALAVLPEEVLADLALLVPEFVPEVARRRGPERWGARPPVSPASPASGASEASQARLDPARLSRSVASFLAALAAPAASAGAEDPVPLVLFLDDLHVADRATFELLAGLLAGLARRPFWVIAAYRPELLAAGHPLLAGTLAGAEATRCLQLERLVPAAVAQVATALVGEAQANDLAAFLAERGEGLPLALTELLNFLWDEGGLVPAAGGLGGVGGIGGVGSGALGGPWRLAAPLDGVELPRPLDLPAMLLRRLHRLPSSARRLASLAAVAGHAFEVEVLRQAGEEHPAVVEIGLELMLERWLLRQFFPYWTSGRRERDLVLWAKGARRGSFEFAHPSIRAALYDELQPARRRVLHGQIAAVLAAVGDGDRAGMPGSEVLAHHLLAAGEWEKALAPVERSAERARTLGAADTARFYYDQALGLLDRLSAGAAADEAAAGWRAEKTRLAARRDALTAEGRSQTAG